VSFGWCPSIFLSYCFRICIWMKLYGRFHISVGLLFWAYVSGLILFAGAQFSVTHMEHKVKES